MGDAYRFCSKGSIERKFVSLHDAKRELFDDMLVGMGGRKPLDVEALRAPLARW